MSALICDGLVEIEIALAVGRPELAGRWDSGTWDATVWAQPDEALGDWVDVTCDVESPFDMAAGTDSADGVVTQWQAATVALTFYGAQYNPRTGPWAGLLGPGLPLRIRWRVPGESAWRPCFAGYVDDGGFHWEAPPGGHPRAIVAATDGTVIMNAADLMKRDPLVGAGDDAGQRIARLADAVDWPDDRRDIQPGGVEVIPTDLGGNAWSSMLLVADTDLAHLWIDRAAVLRYLPQGRVRPQEPPAAILSCEPDDAVPGVPVIPPVAVAGQQPTVLRNVANIQRAVPQGDPAAPIVTLADETSIARYLRRPYSRTDLLHTDDAYGATLAAAVLDNAAWPSFAPESVELHSRAEIRAAYLLLMLEPDLTVRVRDADGSVWDCQPAGWDVSVGRKEISGVIALNDVSKYVGARWDSAGWDRDRWSH